MIFVASQVSSHFGTYCDNPNQILVSRTCSARPACVPQNNTALAPAAITTPSLSVSSSATTAPAPANTTAAPATTATAPSGAGAYQVKLSLTLATTLAAFNDTVQRAFKTQMALAAGLAAADYTRVQLAIRGGRRLLDGGSIVVDVTIAMPDAASANKAVADLTTDKINAQLAAAGLPAATVTSPAVASPVPTGGAGRARPPPASGSLCAAAAGSLGALAAALGRRAGSRLW